MLRSRVAMLYCFQSGIGMSQEDVDIIRMTISGILQEQEQKERSEPSLDYSEKNKGAEMRIFFQNN